jgi:hypothetical protein
MFKIERMTEESNKKKRAVESEILDTTTFQVNEYFQSF